MGMENFAAEVSDFAGEVMEGIKDSVENLEEFSKDMLENIGEQGREALENGDLEGAIDCSDIPDEDKELAKEAISEFGLDKGLMVSGLTVIGGTLGAVVALATPGFQVTGVVAAASAVSGLKDLISQMKSSNVPANA